MNVNCINMAQFTIMQLCLRKHVYVNKYVTAECKLSCAVCCKRVYVNKEARCHRARLNVN